MLPAAWIVLGGPSSCGSLSHGRTGAFNQRSQPVQRSELHAEVEQVPPDNARLGLAPRRSGSLGRYDRITSAVPRTSDLPSLASGRNSFEAPGGATDLAPGLATLVACGTRRDKRHDRRGGAGHRQTHPNEAEGPVRGSRAQLPRFTTWTRRFRCSDTSSAVRTSRSSSPRPTVSRRDALMPKRCTRKSRTAAARRSDRL